MYSKSRTRSDTEKLASYLWRNVDYCEPECIPGLLSDIPQLLLESTCIGGSVDRGTR